MSHIPSKPKRTKGLEGVTRGVTRQIRCHILILSDSFKSSDLLTIDPLPALGPAV